MIYLLESPTIKTAYGSAGAALRALMEATGTPYGVDDKRRLIAGITIIDGPYTLYRVAINRG